MFWEWTWNCIKLWTLSKCSFKDFLLEKTWNENPPKLFLELSAMTSCISVEGSDSEVFTDAPEVDETTKRRNFQTKTKTVAVNQCSGNPQELKEAIKRGDVERLGLLLKEDVGMLELNEKITAMKWVFEIKMRSFQISCFLAWSTRLTRNSCHEAMNHRFFIFRHPCPNVVIKVLHDFLSCLPSGQWLMHSMLERIFSTAMPMASLRFSTKGTAVVGCIFVDLWNDGFQHYKLHWKGLNMLNIHSETHPIFMQNTFQKRFKIPPKHLFILANLQLPIGISNCWGCTLFLGGQLDLWSVGQVDWILKGNNL